VRSSARFRIRAASAVGIATLVVVACSAPAAGGPTAGGSTPGATNAATSGPATPGSATGAPSTAAGTPMVDLTFTGTFNFTAKGTKGRCIVVGRSDGTTAFGFEATEADYPGLGQSYSMGEFGGVDVKWIKDEKSSWGNNPNATITVTPDHHGISIDQDLSPFTNMSTGDKAGPEHVKGTIACP
jgi:hypothetical protein